ncbi:MAG: hypothetical protein ACFFCW_42935 [Candidatus Hodarchaeota archaeon]
MSIGNINGLIRDWRRGKTRGIRRDTFASNRKGYQQLVAALAGEYLPRIREFVTADATPRKSVLKAWKQLMTDFEEDMRMLDAFDPTGKALFSAAIMIAQGALRDKKAQKAFEQSKLEPVDIFGNPELISCIAASLDTIIDQTYHAMRGMTGKDLRSSLVRRASQRLHNALTQGVVRDLNEVQTLLLPPLAVVEMEHEKFLIGQSESRH